MIKTFKPRYRVTPSKRAGFFTLTVWNREGRIVYCHERLTEAQAREHGPEIIKGI